MNDKDLDFLRKRLGLLELVFDNLPNDLVLFNKDHEYIYVNKKAIKDPETRLWIIGKTDFDYAKLKGLSDDFANKRRQMFLEALKGNSISTFDEQRNGEVINRSMVPIITNGEERYVMGYAYDVTSIRGLEKEIIDNQRKITKLNRRLMLEIDHERLRADCFNIIKNNSELALICNQLIEKISSILGFKFCLIKLYSSEFVENNEYTSEDFSEYRKENFMKYSEFSNILSEMKEDSNNVGKNFCSICFDDFSGEVYAVRSIEDKIEGCFFVGARFKESFEMNWENDFLREISALLAMRIAEVRAFFKIKNFNNELLFEVENRTKELIAVNKGLEMFTAIASHDLKGPLRIISNYAELLIRLANNEGNKIQIDYLNFIHGSAKQLNTLIDSLLEFSKSGTKPIDYEKIPLKKLVKEIIESNGIDYQKENLSILINIEGEIYGDQILLRQALTNLLTNAIKFRRKLKNSFVEINAGPIDNAYKIVICDNGIGMDSSNLNKVFQPLNRLDKEGKIEGHGVGLFIVKSIIEKHNGTIECSSVLGKETKFTITLPVVKKG